MFLIFRKEKDDQSNGTVQRIHSKSASVLARQEHDICEEVYSESQEYR